MPENSAINFSPSGERIFVMCASIGGIIREPRHIYQLQLPIIELNNLFI